MALKKNDEENKIITKIDNKWEFLAFALKYRTKEILFIIVLILIFILYLNNSGFDFIGFIKSFFGGKK